MYISLHCSQVDLAACTVQGTQPSGSACVVGRLPTHRPPTRHPPKTCRMPQVNAGQGPACNDTFTISFFVPPEHQVRTACCWVPGRPWIRTNTVRPASCSRLLPAAASAHCLRAPFTRLRHNPSLLQSNPSAPSDEAVFIERRPALTVYVASFHTLT